MPDINKQDQKQPQITQHGAGNNEAQILPGVQAGLEMIRRAGEATNESLRRSAEVAIATQFQIAQDSFRVFEEMRRQAAQMACDTKGDTHRFLMLPTIAGRTLRDVQQGVTGLVEGAAQINLRTAQASLRAADPAGLIALQQRFIRDHVDLLTQGTATLMRAVQRTTEEALRPQKEQVQQHRTEEHYRQAAE
ncbi:phasin family protein [Teichococcus oryzae]|uniref:Phasin domain-containing protein n=1 Tax=Teichococcus oryzae TaxID=1608942 RepID=A0A5B2TBW8_9PROT|nr:phasin family protein [Pseudoroseomonas oryzae]KAA2212002.1 hypothetical protein F0Q34_16925 [Pseudoroseomonas oryzae]